MQVKTIDITGLSWFDRINGNSYCAGSVTLNYGLPDEITLNFPFQYGYGDYYIQAAEKRIKESGLLNIPDKEIFWRYCQDNNIILRKIKHEGCKKKELKEFTSLYNNEIKKQSA